MINNLKTLELTIEQNKNLTFEEYQQMREPAVNVIVNDYACKLLERAKENGEEMTLAEAKERAKKEIPATFVPEWMKNLRINANIAVTELVYLEGLASSLGRIEDLLQAVFEKQIDAYVQRHAKDIKREG